MYHINLKSIFIGFLLPISFGVLVLIGISLILTSFLPLIRSTFLILDILFVCFSKLPLGIIQNGRMDLIPPEY